MPKLSVLLLLLLLAGPAQARCPTPALAGVFYQPLAAHATWSPDTWQALGESLATADVRELVIQWTAADGVAFYPTRHLTPITPSPVTELLKRHGPDREIWLGLDHDPTFFKAFSYSQEPLRFYLTRRTLSLAERLPELAAWLSSLPPVAGIYLSDEIHDHDWLAETPRQELIRYLGAMVALIHQTFPGRPVAISGFNNGQATPAASAAFFAQLLQASGIDRLLFQDGIGAGHHTLDELPLYQAPLAEALTGAGKQLDWVVELFQARPPGSAGCAEGTSFCAEAAPWTRVRQQLQLAGQNGGRRIGFSLVPYFWSGGEPAARRLAADYGEARRGCPSLGGRGRP